ncbi:FixH family protein [Desulfurivibrio alkaliphilus]|uniref:FixH family protein n=1 Tax=Desulfurivibrio alkaliphilus (strain DSM 19089 / UNIQEM U267 / AHT2) TaxID=589865 RepID=D6Z609_DESAT|nr:FixH family protein [Desulfurivibrio alkaliphilus]ADH84891.1 FixH family protein [Desulfurivibrio alkaliphilus AHT 2]
MPQQISRVDSPPVSIYRWPLMLGGLFLSFLLFSSWSIIQAGAKGSPVVDPDYYASGQAYHNDERAWRAAAEAGWRLWLSKEDEELRVRLVDGAGQPISGGEVTLRVARRAAGNPALWQVELSEVSPGVYRAMAAELPAGAVEMVLTAATAEAELQRRFKVVSGPWQELAL